MGEASPDTGEVRILIVDAYSHSREGLRTSLMNGGCAVETAATSWEAINRMKEGRFDAAIIDLDLPPAYGVAMSGWDLARIFRALNPQATTFVMGAEGGREIKARAEELGVVQHFEKPINLSEVRAIVRAVRRDSVGRR